MFSQACWWRISVSDYSLWYHQFSHLAKCSVWNYTLIWLDKIPVFEGDFLLSPAFLFFCFLFILYHQHSWHFAGITQAGKTDLCPLGTCSQDSVSEGGWEETRVTRLIYTNAVTHFRVSAGDEELCKFILNHLLYWLLSKIFS